MYSPNMDILPTPTSLDSINGSRAFMTPKKMHTELAQMSYLIISGGTGANSIASAFGPSPAFILPVSDDGGSSSEILRCFGGPSIGDIRSRLIRLIPLSGDQKTKDEKEIQAIYNLMAFRFPAEASETVVRELWMEIVEGRSQLWTGIGEDKKECIRAFLVHFQTLCLRRAHKRFSFRNFSLGNGFLTGARDLFSSLPSAIFLFKSIAGLSAGVQVIPAINTNQTVTIAAQLIDQSTLIGQCTISHPTPPVTPLGTSPNSPLLSPLIPYRGGIGPQTVIHSRADHMRHGGRRDSRTFDTAGITTPVERHHAPLDLDSVGMTLDRPVSIPEETFAGGNISYRKGEGETPLESRIERVFYINLYGQEIFPDPNPDFLEILSKRDILVYSCGSLWTSIIPSLALRGVGTAIATSPSLQAKVILLNAENDRETAGYTASNYVTSIVDALNHYDRPRRRLGKASNGRDTAVAPWQPNQLITHLAYLEGAKVELDEMAIAALGAKIVKVSRDMHGVPVGEIPRFTNEIVAWTMRQVMENR